MTKGKKFKSSSKMDLSDAEIVPMIRQFIDNHPGTDAEEICIRLGIPLAQVVRLTDYLLKQGYIEGA